MKSFSDPARLARRRRPPPTHAGLDHSARVMAALHFDVYGQLFVDVVRESGWWEAYRVGVDGKRVHTGIRISGDTPKNAFADLRPGTRVQLVAAPRPPPPARRPPSERSSGPRRGQAAHPAMLTETGQASPDQRSVASLLARKDPERRHVERNVAEPGVQDRSTRSGQHRFREAGPAGAGRE